MHTSTGNFLFQQTGDLVELGIELGANSVERCEDEMPAAISPYSIAVAPDSSLRKATILELDMEFSH